MVYVTQFKGNLDLTFKNKAQRKKVQKQIEELEASWMVDGDHLKWDGSENTENYIKWLKHILVHIMKEEGVSANGEIRWKGEDMGDSGLFEVVDNHLVTKGGHV